jgi:hypothetical protein
MLHSISLGHQNIIYNNTSHLHVIYDPPPPQVVKNAFGMGVFPFDGSKDACT